MGTKHHSSYKSRTLIIFIPALLSFLTYTFLLVLMSFLKGKEIVFFLCDKNIWLSSIVFLLSSIALLIILHEFFSSFIKTKGSDTSNVRLLFYSVIMTLFFMEIVLHLLKINATPSENKGMNNYYSFFKPKSKGYFWVYSANAEISYQNNEFSYHRKTNSLGFCDREPVLTKKNNEFRILCLGDSYTEGVGTSFDSSWVRQTDSLLNKHSDCLYTLINAGVSGSDPFYEYMLLKEKLLIYKPDLVIININDNDLDDITIRGGMERFKSNGKVEYMPNPPWEWLYVTSYLFRIIIRDVLHYDMSLIKMRDRERLKREAIDKIYVLLDKYNELAVKNHFRVLLTIFPMWVNIQSNDEPLERLVTNYKMPSNISVISMLTYLTKTENINAKNVLDYYWFHDCHPNGKGYAAFARGLALKLATMKMVNKAK